ncbi:MAG: hypothetical protein EOO43_08475, partial [Flavobacterium sp.]
ARVIKRHLTRRSCICFCVEHNERLPLAVISILKSGNAYVSLDPTYPRTRLEYIVNDLRPVIILTDNQNVELTQGLRLETPTIILNVDDHLSDDIDKSDLTETVSGNDIAYILYTSGSTGRPKGVKQLHKNVLHYISTYTSFLKIDDRDNLSGFSASSYDSFNNDFFGAVLNGATYFPLSLRDITDADILACWIKENNITIWHSIPTIFKLYANQWVKRGLTFPSLKVIKMTGEPVRKDHFENFKSIASEHCSFVVSLGTTESTLFCINKFSTQYVPLKSMLPVGFPINNTSVFIAGANMQRLNVLEIGEIIVESDYISTGYISEKSERPVLDLKNNYYRTGDLGRQLPDGRIEWLSRINGYVKVNGIRIDPVEIEYYLSKHPYIQEAIVKYCQVKDRFELTCFYESHHTILENDVRKFLEGHLPKTHLPNYYFRYMEFPKTSSGKIDRKNIVIPENVEKKITFELEPENDETERSLMGIWLKILKVDSVDTSTSFFINGGNSIKAMVLLQEIKSSFGKQLSLKDIFENTTIRELASHIRIRNSEKDMPQPVDVRNCPLSNSQNRIWIQSQLVPYNITGAYKIKGKLNIDLLEIAFRRLLERHGSLRTSFKSTVEGIFQFQHLHSDLDFNIQRFDIRLDEDTNETIEGLISKESLFNFNLEKAPLLRINVIRLKEAEFILTVTAHHIIVDGWSMEVLAREVFALYKSLKYGIQHHLPELPFQYKDFCLWMRKKLGDDSMKPQREYWLNKFKDGIPIINLPLDHPRPIVKSFRGAVVNESLSDELASIIRKTASENDTTSFVTLLAAFKILLF